MAGFIIMIDIGRCFKMQMTILIHLLSNQKDSSRTDNWIQISAILLPWVSDLVEGGNELSLSEVILIKWKLWRSCPGFHLASSAVWLTVATILATFNLSKAVDEDGKVIEPCVECGGDSLTLWVKSQSVKNQSNSSWNSRPLPFECSMKPRSDVAERLIRSVVDSFWTISLMRGHSWCHDFYVFNFSMYYAV